MKDGGSAFPKTLMDQDGDWWCPDQGMTLRDYFAASALAVLDSRHPDYHGPQGPEVTASNAYMVADAMLAEREKDDE